MAIKHSAMRFMVNLISEREPGRFESRFAADKTSANVDNAGLASATFIARHPNPVGSDLSRNPNRGLRQEPHLLVVSICGTVLGEGLPTAAIDHSDQSCGPKTAGREQNRALRKMTAINELDCRLQ
jgi:hypothetical protein